MRGSDFIFDCINLLYYKCHKINANRGGLYTGPDLIKNKIVTINPISEKDNKCVKTELKLRRKRGFVFLYDSEWRNMALNCSKRVIYCLNFLHSFATESKR